MMMSRKNLVPPTKSTATTSTLYDHSKSNDLCFIESEAEKNTVKSVPVYMKRRGFRPRNPEDFGDGGAFPEIHVAQCPLGMGIDRISNKVLPVTVAAHGNVVFDTIVMQNDNSKKIVYSQHSDLIPRILENEGDVEEFQEVVTTEETKAAIEKIVKAAQPYKSVLKQSGDSKHIKYTPSQQSAAAFNSGAKERNFRVTEMPVDPLDLSKFRHKRVPVSSASPNPVPVMHSPPRDVTGKELQDWNIPPCVSDWKNQKGYTIPLEKRLSADGRVLQEVQINDGFAKLSESLDVCERKAREAVSMRLKVQREMVMKEKERKEQELRALAQKARSERTGAASENVVDEPRGKPKETREEEEERIQREKIREERRRERRRVGSKKSKITRDRDRDVSEKVALGMAFTGGRGGGDMYDQRLFNQEKGMDSGFATDEGYNVYDKGLFTAQPTLSTLYRPKKDMDDEMYGNADERLDKLKNTDRFKPGKAFTSSASERAGKRDRPVEFEKEGEEQDLFGLNLWVSDLKKGKKILNKIGSGWTFRGTCSSRDDDHGGSGRTKTNLERGS